MRPVRTILLVDDDIRLLAAMDDALERDGLNCYRATCPSEAIELAQSHQFDATILDMFLGSRTGLETLVELRAIHQSMAAILISGHLTAEIRAEAKSLGVNCLLDKPIELADLRRAILSLTV
ncbi:MAG: DNA-binding NtrC family response regulator [Planctomycetota bacterium]